MSVVKGERRSRGELQRVLVVDDEADIRELLDLTLSRMGLAADCAGTVGEARELLAAHPYQLCLTDMRLPDGEGLELVRLIGEHYSATPVAVITAFGSAENAVAALKAGAFDYLAKPVALDQLRSLIKSALEIPGQPAALAAEGGLIGASRAIGEVREMIGKLARSQAPVYISGESGSGKELAARLIHQQSNRSEGPFVPVNCGAIPENLMESEFFGYRKGAFTGAEGDREGFFQAASGGTLFLDEVADLPLSMQVKLLRALQEKKVRRIGATGEEAVDVRVICATHKDLQAGVAAGSFRQDLYYRLNVIELFMPPLRERPEDIPDLAIAILARLAGSGQTPHLDASAMTALSRYAFPGNVRELENVLERALALHNGQAILADDLRLSRDDGEAPEGPDLAAETLDAYLARVERQAIGEAVAKTQGNRTAAARLLGVTFRSLRYRMERLGMD
ncbi:sigma-54-dependent transcriptional regulator [Azospira inquinata]|uniref:Sigma-54-dependent Fis family transcriptional regulator n=1 Tax=Azospira inquinata TaxID=2785627 RepID=A0A975SLV9_9RHOO|nr:sigma-54 dependent transcriptional regulator [Azospira inquinata]QWT46387.1 sigma-54-dependent Fis family transcriptional regulator [Azospira inquinata]QWT48290.1 sigma-54-dependent Fis family transcriptional regulator [Azospira inquinata]